MTSERSDNQLIEDILAGESSPDDHEIRARLLMDSDLDERLEQNLRTQLALDQSAALAREILNDRREDLDDLPGADRVASTLQQLAAKQRPEPTLRLVPRWAAAAAILIAALGIGLALNPWDNPTDGSGSHPAGSTYLGGTTGSTTLVVGPRGTVESFGPFRPGSAYRADPDWRFMVHVHDAEHVAGEPIAEGSFGFDSEWSMSTVESAGVHSIYWRVTLEDEFGNEVDRAEGRASLR